MRTIKSFISILAVCSLALLPMLNVSANTEIGPLGANSMPVAPTLLFPQNASQVDAVDVTLSGLTLNGTDVEIYIDGVYSGNAVVKEEATGTASFSYAPSQLLSEGVHNAFTRAINVQNFNLKSDFSPLVTFNVTSCLAPTLVEPTGTIFNGSPVIKGSAPSNSQVQIYIDKMVFGTVQTENNASGTAEFIFTAPVLAEGIHTVYAITLQPNINASVKSNVLEFTIAKAVDAAISAPTLLEPTGEKLVDQPKPVIKGVAHNKQVIDVFVDGVMSGTVTAGVHDSGVAGFTYRPSPDLTQGLHVINAQARNGDGKISKLSNSLVFQTGQYYPAPIVVNTEKEIINPSETVVAGVVKSNSTVKVYVDDKLNGELKAIDHPSGTASFSYKLSQAVGLGTHTLYTVAMDDNGKESKTSNAITFDYKPAVLMAKIETEGIVAKADENKGEEVAKNGEDKEKVVVKTEDGTVSSSATENKDQPNSEVAVQTQNQSDNEQNKSIGLIVLVAVVILLVVWFFWVNKDYFIRKMKGIEKPTEGEVEAIEIEEKIE